MSNIFNRCRSNSNSTQLAPVFFLSRFEHAGLHRFLSGERSDFSGFEFIHSKEMRCGRCRWQDRSFSSCVFHLTFVRRLERRQFFSLPPSRSLFAVFTRERREEKAERKRKQSPCDSCSLVCSVFPLSRLSPFFARFSRSRSLSLVCCFSHSVVRVCALVCLSLDAFAAVLCLVHHIYSTFVCLSTGAAIHFPHHCIFPSRRRCCCITDGARQCPLLVLIYYSLLYWSSNDEVGCKSKMVDVFSYHSVENPIVFFRTFLHLGRTSITIMSPFASYRVVRMVCRPICRFNTLLFQCTRRILPLLGTKIPCERIFDRRTCIEFANNISKNPVLTSWATGPKYSNRNRYPLSSTWRFSIKWLPIKINCKNRIKPSRKLTLPFTPVILISTEERWNRSWRWIWKVAMSKPVWLQPAHQRQRAMPRRRTPRIQPTKLSHRLWWTRLPWIITKR